MAKFTGTKGKDNFNGGAANDVFVFNTDHLASSDRISGRRRLPSRDRP